MTNEKILNSDDDKWDSNITPSNKLLDLNIKELWQYRDLLFLFVKKDIITVYKQTILGPIWFIIQPILTTFVFVILFSKMAGFDTGNVPPFLFYMISITLWSYFADTLNITSKTFTDNANIFGKVYFPRLILPLSKVFSGFIKFLIQFAFFMAFWLYYTLIDKSVVSNWYILITPFLLLIMVTLGLGFGILITSLTTKYRDLTFLITFGVQLLMYGTPVAYSLTDTKVEKYKNILLLNPLTSIFEAFKFAFFGRGEFNLFWLSYSVIFTLLLLIIGIIVFKNVEKRFIDVV